MSATSGIHGMSGANPMTDPLEFVRNMWGAMKIPGMAMPSMSPDEINKQITDLKAVESWLQLNMNMLRSSIQALEIQSATLTTLQTMGQNFAQAVKPHADTVKASAAVPEFESPFAHFSAAAKPNGADANTTQTSVQADSGSDAAAMAAQFVNPAAWWNVVQDQFTQAVGSAMTVPVKKTARKSAGPSAAQKKSAPKSASRSEHKTATSNMDAAKAPARKKTVKKKSVS